MSEELKRAVFKKCSEMEIPIVGVADVKQWENPPFDPWMPKEYYPQSIYPDAKSVIVIGLPVLLPALETSPSIFYHELYTTMNILLDQYTYRLANFLNSLGSPSVFVPRNGYSGVKGLLKDPFAFFSHRHAAYFAGLGNFGTNNMLLTPQFGPRVRFGSIFTTAKLPPDPPMTDDLCIKCMRCVDKCPSNAFKGDDYPSGLTDKMSCTAYNAKLSEDGISPCGICIKVCPVGDDWKFYGREKV